MDQNPKDRFVQVSVLCVMNVDNHIRAIDLQSAPLLNLVTRDHRVAQLVGHNLPVKAADLPIGAVWFEDLILPSFVGEVQSFLLWHIGLFILHSGHPDSA